MVIFMISVKNEFYSGDGKTLDAPISTHPDDKQWRDSFRIGTAINVTFYNTV